MAYGQADWFRVRIQYNAQGSPAQLLSVEMGKCTRDLSDSDQTVVEQWVKDERTSLRAGDVFQVTYTTSAFDPASVTFSALANQAGGAVCTWRPETFWSYYD